MGLLSLILSYANSFYYIIQSYFVDINASSFGLKAYSVLLFIICFIIYGFYIINKNYISKSQFIIVIFSYFILIDMLITIIKYGYLNEGFIGQLLSFGSQSLPAILIGSLIACKKELNKMMKWLQPFMLMYTITVLIVTLTGYNVHLYMIKGFNYQILSYYAVFAIGINIFLITYYNKLDNFKIFKNRIWRYINVLLALIQLLCMLIGGGRGAFVLCFVYLLYLPIYFKKNMNTAGRNSLFIISISIIIVFILGIFNINRVLNMNGLNRVLNFFFNYKNIINDYRNQLYINALKIFIKKPVFGHGIGSIMYELGFYSHNAFCDILVEKGLFGFSISIYLLILFFIKIKKISKKDWKKNIIMVIFLSSFIMLMFSGYYLNNSGIWFCFGYVFTKEKTTNKIHKHNCNKTEAV